MSESENLQKLLEILASVLDIAIGTINDETSPENTETWDSYNGLMMISELENTFNVHFTMDEAIEVTCVRDIKKALKRHGVSIEVQ